MKIDIWINRIESRIQRQSVYLWSADLKQECQDHSMGKERSFQQMMLEQVDSQMQKNEVGFLLHTIYKN